MAKTKRFEIRAEDAFIEKLEQLATASGVSKANIIDRAIGLYAKALEEAEQGKVIRFVPMTIKLKEKAGQAVVI